MKKSYLIFIGDTVVATTNYHQVARKAKKAGHRIEVRDLIYPWNTRTSPWINAK